MILFLTTNFGEKIATTQLSLVSRHPKQISEAGQGNTILGGEATQVTRSNFNFEMPLIQIRRGNTCCFLKKNNGKSGERKNYSSVHSQGRLLLGVMLADTKTRPLRLGSDTDFVIQVLAGQISLHLLTRPVDINLCKDQSSTHNTQ